MENNGTPNPPEVTKTEGTKYEIVLPDDPNDEIACDGCQ